MARRLQILLLEDNPSDAELMARELPKAGLDADSRRVETEAEFRSALEVPPDLILADYHLPQFNALQALQILKEKNLDLPLIVVTGALGDESAAECVKQGAADFLLKDRLGRLGAACRQALENKRLRGEQRRAEELQKQRATELEALNQVSRALRAAHNPKEMLSVFVHESAKVLEADNMSLLLVKGRELEVVAGCGETVAILGERFPRPADWLDEKFRNGEPRLNQNLASEDTNRPMRVCKMLNMGMAACACVALATHKSTIGLLHAGWRNPCVELEPKKHLLSVLGDLAASAIQRSSLHDETRRRLQRLTALRAIDVAISGSVDLRVTLGVLLDQVMSQLGADATSVRIMNPFTRSFDFASGRGFRTNLLQKIPLRLGDGTVGRTIAERRTLKIHDFADVSSRYFDPTLIAEEKFVSYFGTPLVAKGEIKGVLELFMRSKCEPDEEWLTFLEALAGQAAIAIDAHEMFEGSQRASIEITRAYDATLEGWVKVLDLRDKESEGHTDRVMNLTLQLARRMAMDEKDLIQIRRGALLHDIGNMSIPDAILLKPAPLTEQEWEIIREHPRIAHQILSPIAYLKPALDIPYCHHERWDGTGYPRGLKGEEIPLAARIFAVVDVWDSLCNDRPFRKAWPPEKVCDYIRNLSGIQFDPRVANAFLESLVQESRRVLLA